VVVAFSGGADSSFLAWVAHDTLGPDGALAVTAVSPSLPGRERVECADLAAEWGLRWREVETDELEQAAYRRNDGDRCYWCKDALLRAVTPLAGELGRDGRPATVVLGVNLDDLDDHRPGQRAAAEPAAACLASRLPYGTPVTLGRLASVERAEAALHALGFREVRVRHYGDTARVEVPLDRLADVVERREQVVAGVRAAGYRYVTLDLEGLRSGNLNQALGLRAS